MISPVARSRRRLGRWARGHVSPRILALFAGASAVRALAQGGVALCAGLIGQALVGNQLANAAGKIQALLGTISPTTLALVGFGAAVVKTAASAVSVYGQRRAVVQVGNAIREDMSVRLLTEGAPAVSVQDVHAAMVLRIREVERGVDEGMFTAARATLELGPLLVGLILLSSQLALLAVLALLPFAVGLSWARKRLRAELARSARLAERLHAGVDELVRHVDLWRTFGAKERIVADVARRGEAAGLAVARSEAGRSALSGMNEALGALALLAVIVWADRGGLAPAQGPLVAFAAVFFMMYRPLRDLGDARTHYDRGAHALVELEQLAQNLGQQSPEREPPSARDVRTWPLRSLRVSTSRPGEGGEAGVRFTAEPGTVTAIIGPTGTGKTTLLRSLLGLGRAATTRVHYGEDDLSEAGVGPAERPFAWVPQEAGIVTGTLAENIAMGAPIGSTADPETSAREALVTLGAGALLPRLRDNLSSGGAELSGGERMWVAMARALVSEQPVLLMDEPTAGLDGAAQAEVLRALEALKHKRTILLVSHRPEPLGIADNVVRLGQGPDVGEVNV